MKTKLAKSLAFAGQALPRSGLVEITLCEPHTHNGVDQMPGDILALPVPIADFLVKAGAAKNL